MRTLPMWKWRAALAALLLTATGFVAPAAADPAIEWRIALLRSLSDSDVQADVSRPALLKPATPEIERAIRDAALRYRLDPALIRAVIRHESAFDPAAVSPLGAMGLMQLMPATANDLEVVRPFDPRENILGGSRYLRRMHDRFGNWRLAVAAYHAGPERVAARRIGPATRRYVRRVLGSWRRTRGPA